MVMSYSVIIIPYYCIKMLCSDIPMQYYHSTMHNWMLKCHWMLKCQLYIYIYSNPITDFKMPYYDNKIPYTDIIMPFVENNMPDPVI